MPCLLNLPTEILTSIYHSINNIDDVLHLARTCRQMHAIFAAPRARVEIFRSVIKNTPHHQTDHQISYLQDLHSTLQTLYSNPTIGFLRPSDKIFTHVDSLLDSTKPIPDAFVWDTVARWHGMKVLFFNLYLDKSIHESYTHSTPPRAQFKESNRYRDKLAAEAPLAPPAGVAIDSAEMIPAQQQGLWRAYERFYHALTLHWAAVETLSLARAASYTTSAERNARFERIWTQWTDTGSARSLSTKVDVLEVVEFVWGYLGRKVFQEEDVIVKWVGGTGAIEEFYDEEEPVGTNWLYFVRSMMRYLRPGHVLELLLRVVWRGEGEDVGGEEIDRVEYLRRVGFFDESAGVVEREDEGEEDPDTVFNIGGLQEDVAVGLEAWAEAHGVDVDTEARWEVYRDKLWGREMRGRVLLREEGEEALFGRIMGVDRGEIGDRANRP
ncbi:hypothetical protein BDW42DRAFT_139765 [Aspergillus taichungensis]|uniref:F-box domain-containing protein n=1 Tax=Aspergillus taichungensis TaxID=482145 RepID=A0A2J5HNG4_9EURO|nr:hypothetical protein BDW42DRAFT_139765 [Aspergillus taichungensis]